jgi:hypothetical protein
MQQPTRRIERYRDAEALTAGPRAHFFGYFDKSPWDDTCQRVLTLEVDAEPADRMPAPDEPADLAYVTLSDRKLHKLGQTHAWNWQQGCMLRWMPGAPDTVIYNDRRDGRLVAVIRNLSTGEERILPRNIFDIDETGRHAVCIDFARLARSRPVVGYSLANDAGEQHPAPAEDGIWLLDLQTGREQLIFSFADAVALGPGPEFDSAHRGGEYAGLPGFEQPGAGGHRFEGASFSPDGRRLMISHRWPRRAPLQLPHFQRHAWDRLIMFDLQTGQARSAGEDSFYSHSTWLDNERVLSWARQGGEDGLWILDLTGKRAPEPFARGIILLDAHPSISPDGRWLLGDSYPDETGRRQLWVCDLHGETCYDIGAFASPPPFSRGPLRCDLHPRWRPDSRAVCVDSVHEGTRQLYAIAIDDLC